MMKTTTARESAIASVPNETLLQEWRELAQPWIKEMREGRAAVRKGLLDSRMLVACDYVAGRKVIDLGCGEGRFCRMLAERGAQVTGVDREAGLISAAKNAQLTDREFYQVGDIEDGLTLPKETYDLAVSYLSLCDVQHLDSALANVSQLVRSGGRFVIANLHPMRSAVGQWQKTDTGVKQHVILDRYFQERPRRWKMLGCEFTNFHRTLGSYLDSFSRAGFALHGLEEPCPTPEELRHFPELADECRVPNFIIYRLTKT